MIDYLYLQSPMTSMQFLLFLGFFYIGFISYLMFFLRQLQYNYLGPSYQYVVIVMRDVVDLTINCPYILLFMVITEIENRKFSTLEKYVFRNIPFVAMINTCKRGWETEHRALQKYFRDTFVLFPQAFLPSQKRASREW